LLAEAALSPVHTKSRRFQHLGRYLPDCEVVIPVRPQNRTQSCRCGHSDFKRSNHSTAARSAMRIKDICLCWSRWNRSIV